MSSQCLVQAMNKVYSPSIQKATKAVEAHSTAAIFDDPQCQSGLKIEQSPSIQKEAVDVIARTPSIVEPMNPFLIVGEHPRESLCDRVRWEYRLPQETMVECVIGEALDMT